MSCPKSRAIDLQPHLLKIGEHLLNHRGLLVVYGTGSGKTLGAISSVQCVLNTYPNKVALIITPASLVANFKKEMVKYGLQMDDPRYTFKTYGEMLHSQNIDTFCTDKILVCDEAHNLRTQISKQGGILAAKMIKCAKNAFKVLLLTATPVVNNPIDIVNLIAMIDGKDPMHRTEFERMLENGSKLRNYFQNKAIFYKRPSNDPNYPHAHERDVVLTMTDSFYKAYHAIELNEFKNNAKAIELIRSKDVFAFLSGVRRAMNVANIENSPKINWTTKLVVEGDGKHGLGQTLIYSAWKSAGKDLILEQLKKQNITVAEVHGSMNRKQRAESVRQYNAKEVTVLLITKAGGEGLDLKDTKYVVVLDPNWNDANLQQIMGRAVRYKSHMGELRDVYIYKLYLQKPGLGLYSGRKWSDNIASADCLLKTLVTKKTSELKRFMAVFETFGV